MQKYVLTGGPGSGKSSIILALEQMGEYVVREAAEDYIKYRQACGQKTPWVEEDFDQKIFELKIQRESAIPKDVKRAFIDRGYLDGVAYISKDASLAERMTEETKRVGYTKVFLVENLGSIETNGVRKEGLEEALNLEKKQYENYTKMGFEVVKIKPGKLDERVAEVMKCLK